MPGRRRGQSRRAQDRRPHRHRRAHPRGCNRGQRARSANGPTRGRSNWSCGLSRRTTSTANFSRWRRRLQRSLNELIYREAQRRGVLCNVVDVPEFCDFFYPAVVRRGDLQIAISTAGQSPSLAQKIRQQLERQFGPGYAEWVEQLGETQTAHSSQRSRQRDASRSCCTRWRAGKRSKRRWPRSPELSTNVERRKVKGA